MYSGTTYLLASSACSFSSLASRSGSPVGFRSGASLPRQSSSGSWWRSPSCRRDRECRRMPSTWTWPGIRSRRVAESWLRPPFSFQRQEPLLLLLVVLVVVSLSRLSGLLSLLLLLIMLEVAVQALQQEAGILTTVFLQYEIVFYVLERFILLWVMVH